jgi:hypothetical protein
MRFTKLTSWLLALAICPAVMLTGCGGSSSLTHAELAGRAGAACRQADAAAARLSAPGDSYSALARYANQLSPIVQRLIAKLGAMKPNANDRPALARYVNALRAGDRGLALEGSAASAAQVTQAGSVLTSQSIPADASALGAPACGASVYSS